MAFYGNRALRGSLGAFGAFAGGGRPIFGPFAFAESWSSDDFESATQFTNWVKPFLDQVARTDLTFSPLSAFTKARAEANYNLWAKAALNGDPQAQAYKDSIDSQMTSLIHQADSLSLSGANGHRSEGTEVARYDAFNSIIALASQLASSSPSPVAPKANVDLTGRVLVGSDTSSGGTAASKAQAAATGGDIVTNGSLQQGNPLPSSGPPWALIIGLGSVALVGGVMLLRRHKAASVSGYRRRRSHR